MRQFDVVNTIVDIVFSGKTTGNYVESQTETTLDCKPKIYIVHGGTLRDHLKNKKETARLTARVINAILCRVKFYPTLTYKLLTQVKLKNHLKSYPLNHMTLQIDASPL